MNADQLAHALGAKRSGRQWVCKCVAHEDKAPSLIIFDGRERVQVRCLAGCAQDDIIDALAARGLWYSEREPAAAPAPRPAPKPEPDRTGIARFLAPMNDLLGLVITEGIEEGLSMFEATGCGVWAAGSASLMGGLGDAVPDWVDCCTVVTDVADAKKAGLRGSSTLVERLLERGVIAEAVASRGSW
jgi:hypothetical protein